MDSPSEQALGLAAVALVVLLLLLIGLLLSRDDLLLECFELGTGDSLRCSMGRSMVGSGPKRSELPSRSGVCACHNKTPQIKACLM